MTAPAAPQPEHCEHEPVCPRHVGSLAWKHSTRCMANQEGCKECIHDTRTRPHTPAPTDEQCRICSEAIARTATLAMLEKVDNRIGDLHYKAQRDNMDQVATGLQQARNVIDNEIESLRSTAGDDRE
jgi:hypothetical protein